MVNLYSISDIEEMLKEVMDPEIPVLSLVDLGVITDIRINESEKVEVDIRPTFIGCPALQQMKVDVESRLAKAGINEFEVSIVKKPSWTTDEISETGREKLKAYGYAPPVAGELIDDIDFLDQVSCPMCDGNNTELKTPFGPTLCRSIHYCHDCQEAFQQIKPLN